MRNPQVKKKAPDYSYRTKIMAVALIGTITGAFVICSIYEMFFVIFIDKSLFLHGSLYVFSFVLCQIRLM